MALNPKLSNTGANAAANAMAALLNGGFVDIYDGTQPATADTAITTQVKLSSIGLPNPAFGSAVNGVATANAITPDGNAAATGTAAWFRSYESDHTTVMFDGSVGTSGCNLNLATTSIVQHDSVTVTSLTLTQSKS